MLKVSVIISLYNEELGVEHFWTNLKNELLKIKDVNFELLWVNDGSKDATQSKIEAIKRESDFEQMHHVLIEFSKNFGHESAIIAGLDHSTGDLGICIDSDGQHPPEKIIEMIEAFKSGSDIVLMQNLDRGALGPFKRLLSTYFYDFMNKMASIQLQKNATDFFLVSKRVIELLRVHYREQNRFIRGFIQSLGFNKSVITYRSNDRLYGKSNYSFLSLFKLAFTAIYAFSNRPLRIGVLISFCFLVFTLLFSVYTVYQYIYGNQPPSGYTTIVLFLSFSFSMLFLTLTILSLYFEKSLQELRQRPLYIVKNKQE